MKNVNIRRNFVLVLVAFILFGVLFLAGCNGNAEADTSDNTSQVENENTDLFALDQALIEESDGYCLLRGDDCYSLMSVVLSEKAKEYNVGAWYNENGGAWIYLHTHDEEHVISIGDFDPMVVDDDDKIISYRGEISFVPVTFTHYTFRGVVSLTDTLTYYPYEDNHHYEDAYNVTVCNSGGASIDPDDMVKDGTYIIKWIDDDGYHEISVVASNRLYEFSGEPITIEGNNNGEYVEYDASMLPSGTYTIVPVGGTSLNADSGIITIE